MAVSLLTSRNSALRRLFKAPFVTSVAILSLALGIGANAAIFSLFNQMLLRPLPVPAPQQLVNLSAPGPKPGSNSCNQAGDCEHVFSYLMFRDLQKAHTVFTDIAAHVLFGANLAFHNQTLNGQGVLVSGSYFPVLGLKPAIGRLLSPHDDQKQGESQVVVLSHAYWTTRFDRNPGVLNDTLIVNGQHLTIVGVAPEGFDGTTLGAKPQVFVPITLRGTMNGRFNQFDNRRNYWAYLFARLRPGVTIDEARAQFGARRHRGARRKRLGRRPLSRTFAATTACRKALHQHRRIAGCLSITKCFIRFCYSWHRTCFNLCAARL